MTNNTPPRVQFDSTTTKFSLPERALDEPLDLALGEGARVYLCAQSVMKMHPEFDEVLVEILERDKDGVVVLLSNPKQAVWQNIVRDRLLGKVRAAGVAETRVLFVPQLERGA